MTPCLRKAFERPSRLPLRPTFRGDEQTALHFVRNSITALDEMPGADQSSVPRDIFMADWQHPVETNERERTLTAFCPSLALSFQNTAHTHVAKADVVMHSLHVEIAAMSYL